MGCIFTYEGLGVVPVHHHLALLNGLLLLDHQLLSRIRVELLHALVQFTPFFIIDGGQKLLNDAILPIFERSVPLFLVLLVVYIVNIQPMKVYIRQETVGYLVLSW